MTAPQFQSFYPQWQQFARYRDPLLTSSFWERVTPIYLDRTDQAYEHDPADDRKPPLARSSSSAPPPASLKPPAAYGPRRARASSSSRATPKTRRSRRRSPHPRRQLRRHRRRRPRRYRRAPALLAHAVNSLTGMDIAYLAHGILGDQDEAEQDFNAAAQILYTNLMAPVSLLTWLANFCVQRHSGVSPSSPRSPAIAAANRTTSMVPRRPASPPSSAACVTASTARA